MKKKSTVIPGSGGGTHIASVSFGKDSLAMLLWLIAKNYQLNEVVFFDTGMEFDSVYRLRDQIKPLLEERGIQYVELQPDCPFLYSMLERPVKNQDGSGYHKGYSWCGGVCRWGTTEKLKKIYEYCDSKNAEVYVGIAVDEQDRIEKEQRPMRILPLVTWGKTEKDCLAFCQVNGYGWVEDDLDGEVDLYDLLDRVSCWCCTNKNLKELRNIFHKLPKYWDRLKDLQSKMNRPMKGPGKSVFDLEVRFQFEDERLAAGLSITTREFHRALKKRIQEVKENEKAQ